MPNEWYTKFYHRYETGAREKFESVCFLILAKQFPLPDYEVFKPRLSQGDKGIDIRVIDKENGYTTIYQCKFFDNQNIDSSQKRQIEDSFQRAAAENKDKFHKWILCVPSDLSVEEMDEWWKVWKRQKEEETNLKVELHDGSNLISIIRTINLYDEIFEEDFKRKIDELHSHFFSQERQLEKSLPYYKNPVEKYVIGFLFDGSEKMLNAVLNNKFENNDDLFKRILNQLKYKKSVLSKAYLEYLKEIQVFFLAYNKVENVLSFIDREKIKDHCIDLLGYADNESYFIFPNLSELNQNFERYKELGLKSLIAVGNGAPFLRGGLKTTVEYFDQAINVKNKILVIFTTGEITKQKEEEIEIYSQELKNSGVSIISVYLQKDMSSFGKDFIVYNSSKTDWTEAACRAFNISSPVDSNLSIYEKIQLLSKANDFPISSSAKLFFPLIPDKTLTFLKFLLFGNDSEDA